MKDTANDEDAGDDVDACEPVVDNVLRVDGHRRVWGRHHILCIEDESGNEGAESRTKEFKKSKEDDPLGPALGWSDIIKCFGT